MVTALDRCDRWLRSLLVSDVLIDNNDRTNNITFHNEEFSWHENAKCFFLYLDVVSKQELDGPCLIPNRIAPKQSKRISAF